MLFAQCGCCGKVVDDDGNGPLAANRFVPWQVAIPLGDTPKPTQNPSQSLIDTKSIQMCPECRDILTDEAFDILAERFAAWGGARPVPAADPPPARD